MWNFTNNYKNGTLINIVHVGVTWLFLGRYKQIPAQPRWGTYKRPKKCFPPSLTEWTREITWVPTEAWFRDSCINEKPTLATGTAQKNCISGLTCPVCRRRHQDSPLPWHRVLWIFFFFFLNSLSPVSSSLPSTRKVTIKGKSYMLCFLNITLSPS